MSNTDNTKAVFDAHNANQEKNEKFLKLCGLAGTVVGTTASSLVAYHFAKKRYN